MNRKDTHAFSSNVLIHEGMQKVVNVWIGPLQHWLSSTHCRAENKGELYTMGGDNGGQKRDWMG